MMAPGAASGVLVLSLSLAIGSASGFLLPSATPLPASRGIVAATKVWRPKTPCTLLPTPAMEPAACWRGWIHPSLQPTHDAKATPPNSGSQRFVTKLEIWCWAAHRGGSGLHRTLGRGGALSVVYLPCNHRHVPLPSPAPKTLGYTITRPASVRPPPKDTLSAFLAPLLPCSLAARAQCCRDRSCAARWTHVFVDGRRLHIGGRPVAWPVLGI